MKQHKQVNNTKLLAADWRETERQFHDNYIFLKSSSDRWAGEQTGRQTDGQRDRQTP